MREDEANREIARKAVAASQNEDPAAQRSRRGVGVLTNYRKSSPAPQAAVGSFFQILLG